MMKSCNPSFVALGVCVLRSALVAMVIVTALVQAGLAETLTADETKVLEARTKLMGEAFRNGDYEEMVDLMHPSAFNFGANKEQMIALLKEGVVKLKEINFAVLDEQLGTPGEVYASGDEVVCFYPRTMVMQMGSRKFKHTGFVICAKKKEGGEWLFIDGQVLAKEPTMLGRLFPDLPKDVKLPEVKTEVVE